MLFSACCKLLILQYYCYKSNTNKGRSYLLHQKRLSEEVGVGSVSFFITIFYNPFFNKTFYYTSFFYNGLFYKDFL